MREAERILVLEQENRRLKEDNEMLVNIIIQMKISLNRLLNRYVLEPDIGKMA